MTEKRFTRISVCGDWGIKDTLTDKVLFFGTTEEVEITLEVLNMLHEENQQLKQTMKEVAELLSDEVDLFSDKAIEHDINAYMELKELDNKDAFYMAKATKTAIKMLMLKGDVE